VCPSLGSFKNSALCDDDVGLAYHLGMWVGPPGRIVVDDGQQKARRVQD